VSLIGADSAESQYSHEENQLNTSVHTASLAGIPKGQYHTNVEHREVLDYNVFIKIRSLLLFSEIQHLNFINSKTFYKVIPHVYGISRIR
jgi:hypothetical protein